MTIPDFGWHEEIIGEQYPVTITCKYVVPGLTFPDLMHIFAEAEKEWKEEDSFSANPSKWKNSRGLNAVLDAILKAIYIDGKSV